MTYSALRGASMLLYITAQDWLIYGGLAITSLAFLLMYRGGSGARSGR
jgi:hypothetical protein